jgi:hypothetical protein
MEEGNGQGDGGGVVLLTEALLGLTEREKVRGGSWYRA